uniref:Uncharacterized protein n=1 Tax=Rhizophora mucronata TaxID=61149 RepID=A0A2P2NQ52_RHIMU
MLQLSAFLFEKVLQTVQL